MGVLEKAEENVRAFALIPAGSHVLVAVSGGADSMVLLDILRRLAPAAGWTLELAHFNHRLRGEASEQDELFVKETAATLDLPFHAGRGDVSGFARANGISIEMAARDLRHGFLAKTAVARGIPIVALAHHADDQVETFWLRLLRGDVGAGLAGMRWKRNSPAEARVQLVRPFLNIAKEALLDYAREKAIRYREDESNSSAHFQRNRLRAEILPALECFQPKLREMTLRAAEALLAEKEFLAESAESWMEESKPKFELLARGLQREIVRRQLLEQGIDPDFNLIEALRAVPDKVITVAPGLDVLRTERGRIEARNRPKLEFRAEQKEIEIEKVSSEELPGLSLSWEFAAGRGPRENNTEYFDARSLGSKIVLRHWRPGDRFQPIGTARAAKLQDIFTNLKVDSEERRKRWLAVAESGGIFWVEGLRIAERFKVKPDSTRILKWRWRRNAESI